MSEIFGHDHIWEQLHSTGRGRRLHHAWLFTGPPGVGKAALARQWALSLLTDSNIDSLAGRSAARLFASGTHPDYIELARLERESGELARNITVDQVRGLHRLLETSPSLSRQRVVLIDSADDLERGGANALLKNLEEPPAGVIFLLICHAPSRLLATIRSRCRLVRFSKLTEPDMRRALFQADKSLTDNELSMLISLGQGSPGKALEAAGLAIDEIDQALNKIFQSGDADNRERLALAKMLSSRTAKPRYEAFLKCVPDFCRQQASRSEGQLLARAIESWENSSRLASSAILLGLDPAAVVFELSTMVANLNGLPHA